MRKMYFTAKPENFIIYDGIARDGKLSYKNYDDFQMDDEFYSRLFFEAPRKTIYGSVVVKEMVTGVKFILELQENKAGTLYSTFSGVDREIKTEKAVLSKTRVDNTAVAGFFKQMEEDEDLKIQYVDNVLQFMAMAKAKTNQRKRDIQGPEKGIVRGLRQLSKLL